MRLSLYIFFVICFFSCNKGQGLKSSQYQNSKQIEKVTFEKSSEMIDELRYWGIIAKSSNNRSSDQKSTILDELSKLTPQEIVGFSLRTTKLLKESYSSDLWCAAYIMKGGCSDDGYEYFRCWLITKGKDVFYKALKNPDSLSELKKQFLSDYEFEELLYLPDEAFKAKTGYEINRYIDMDTFLKLEGSYPEITLNWQEDNKESMKKICPKLFKKY
jgi:hypothetical protein